MSASTRRYPAPAVRFRLVRCRILGFVLCLLQIASLANLVAWMFWGHGSSRFGFNPTVACAAVAWAAAAIACARLWLHQPSGWLAWIGSAWEFHSSPDASGGVTDSEPLGHVALVCWDLQACMLIKLPDARSNRWMFVRRAHDPFQWLALRRAVYSSASSAPAMPEEPFQTAPGVRA